MIIPVRLPNGYCVVASPEQDGPYVVKFYINSQNQFMVAMEDSNRRIVDSAEALQYASEDPPQMGIVPPNPGPKPGKKKGQKGELNLN